MIIRAHTSAWAFPAAVASLAFTFAVGSAPADSDMFWHLATARWEIAHGQLLHEDVFSSTVRGEPYGIGEWLGQLVFGGAWLTGGWGALVLVRSLLIAFGAFWMARLALRTPGVRALVAGTVVLLALLVANVSFVDRPLLFTFALFPLTLELLYRVREGQSRALWALALIMLVWPQLHGGHVLGLALVGAFGVHELVTGGIRGPRTRGVFALAAFALLVSRLDPAPFNAGFTLRENLLAPPRFIEEFRAPDVAEPASFVFMLFVLAVIGLALAYGGSVLDAILLLPLLYLAMTAQRHMIFFIIASLPFVTPRLARLSTPVLARLPELPSTIARGVALTLVLFALLHIPTAPQAPDLRRYPTGALATLREGSGVLINEYDWGGYLILYLPERPVFIDGRYVPYRMRGVMDDYRSALATAPGWRAVLERYDVQEVLLRPERPLTGALLDSGWQVLGEETGRWIYLRRGAR